MTSPTSNARLIADIGGTNARFALSKSGTVDPNTRRDFAVADYPSFDSCLDAYFAINGLASSDFDEACISVAGPVVENTIDFTNNDWVIDGNSKSKELGRPIKLINDFESMAYAASDLTADDITLLGDAPFSEAKPSSRLTIMGPGTGLGVANGFWTDQAFHPLAGEGGHITCAASSAEQHEVIEQIRTDLGLQRVSMERILSGPGLMNLYRAVCKLANAEVQYDTPAEVTRNGKLNTHSLERKSIDLFCEFLGACAGDIALTFGTKHGVFLAGGVTKALADYLPNSSFRSAFINKGRLSYFVEGIPTALITADDPGLRGAAVANI